MRFLHVVTSLLAFVALAATPRPLIAAVGSQPSGGSGSSANTVQNVTYVNSLDNLSSAMTNAPNNSTILIGGGDWTNHVSYFASNYNLGDFYLQNKTNVTIMAIGKAVLHATNEGDILVLTNCSRIRLIGLGFEGTLVTNVSGLVAWAATWISACKDVEVSDCTYRHIGNHAISEDLYNPANFQSTNVYIFNNTFFRVGSWVRDALGWDGSVVNIGSFWKIYRNRLYECATCIEFYGNQGPVNVANSEVADNYIENPIKWGIADAASTNNSDHKIQRNVIIFNDGMRTESSNSLANASRGMSFTITKNFVIDGNYVSGPKQMGIFLINGALQDCFNTSITGNVISNSNDGIYIAEAAGDAGKHRGNKVSGNRVVRMVSSGMTICGTDTWVTDNDLEDVGTSFGGGIRVAVAGAYVATNITVVNNRIRASPGATTPNPAIDVESGAVNCRQFGNDITGGYTPRISDNGATAQPSLYIEMVTGIATNPFVLYNTNRAPVAFFDSRGFLVITNGLTNRLATPTNTIAIGADNFGGFNLPNWTDHNGLQATLQPFLANENVYWINTSGGGSLVADGTLVTTNGGCVISHSTPIESQPYMVQLDAPASSNGCASVFSSVAAANAGAQNGSSKIGGYFHAATWCSTNLIAQVVGGGAPRTFVGLTARVAEDYTNMVVTTNATGQYVGLYVDAAQSTNIYMSARDGTAEFRTNTGMAFVATNVYKFYLCNAPTSRFVGWRLDDAYSGGSVQGWFSNNVPTNFMMFGIATKNGTNRAHSVRFSRLYLQAPLAPPR